MCQSAAVDSSRCARKFNAPVCKEYSEMKPLKVSSVLSFTSR